MTDKKFSDFTDGNEVQAGDVVVGLRSGVNYRFSFPSDGIKDSSGNYFFKYETPGAASVNYPNLISSATGNAITLEAAGSDAHIDFIVKAKGTGVLQMPSNITQVTQLNVDNIRIDGNTISSTDAAGDIIFTPNTTGSVVLDGVNWPQADGSAGQILVTDGAGQTSWTTAATGTVTSVSGTSNRISSTGGTTPVIDIDAAYVGQASITTLGTVATGTWNADVITGTYGGTGVNNGASTITVGGNTEFSGAFTFTGTVTANTAITFPTTGTLATETYVDATPAVLAEQYFNSIALDSPAVSVSSDGATITFSIEKSGTGDIRFLTSNGMQTLDCTPANTVTLTAGTDATPVQNYVYVLESNIAAGTLTASTVGWPNAEYCALATVVCQSAATLQTDGAYKMHAWTDHVKNSIDLGHGADINYWIRQQNATWSSGVALTPTVGAATFDLATTAGVVLQLHQHAYPAFDTSTGSHLYVPNWNASSYQRFTDLTTVLTDSSGASMSGKHYNLIVWGVVSEATGDCQLMVNVPTASYNNSTNAIADVDRTSVYTIPAPFIGCGFLIARLTMQNSGGAGGTFTLTQQEDLRSLIPATATGSGTGGITSLSDDPAPTLGGDLGQSTFVIKDLIAGDAADTTKQFEIDVNGATTASKMTLVSNHTTDRTITLPDATTTLMDTSTAQEYTATKNFNMTTLTSTSNSIAWDLSANQVAQHTATENTTLAAPTNQVAGATYIFIFVQDSTPRTLAFNAAYKFPGGTAPTVSTGSGAIDVITFVSDGTNMLGTFAQDFS